MSNQLNELIGRAERLSDEDLKKLLDQTRKQVLNGQRVEGLDATETLMLAQALKQIAQQRTEGTASRRESLDELAGRLSKDVGMSVEDAKQWIRTKGNPYDPGQRKSMLASEWNGIERRGIRKPGFTAADLDAQDDREFSQPPSEQRTVRRQHAWGE